MFEDSVTMRRPVEKLTKSNWCQVFTDLQFWIESKGLFYDSPVIERNKGSKEKEVKKLTAGIDNLNINKKSSLNIEKATQWDKDASAVMYWLRQCCSNDTDITEEQGNPRQSWKALYRKYSKVKPGDLRQLKREITSFDRVSQASGKSPEDCFALLKVLRRRFIIQKPEKNESLINDNLFGYLLDGFTETEWKLYIILNIRKRYHEVAKEWAVQQRLNDERLPHTLRSKQKSKFQPMPKNLASKERNVHFEEPRSARVAQAYSAKDVNNDCYENGSEEESLDTGHEDGDISEEGLMALGDRHPRSKPYHSLTPTIWHPDTAASSHMTDSPKLLKGPLRPTRRAIRVGVGKLLSREMGDAWMVTKSGVAFLKDCLLVHGLGWSLKDYAVESGAYVRNRLQRGPWIENEIEGEVVQQQISPEGAWTDIYSQDIDHLRVWGCQAIPYVDIGSMPRHARTDKLVPRRRKAVFVGYVDETTKQWKMCCAS
ncbi:hypothetical protein K3495_g4819 [Podosphaera aphanis]|nr:hypothetical protein K3495_g4819 [Podosphaera aphanis]